MDKTKKQYGPPKVQKVRLVVKNAVLGTCHESPTMVPLGAGFTCVTNPTPCFEV